MKRIAFTLGAFDCIGLDHVHLVKEMRKVVMPDNEIAVILYDDYANFVNTKKFPIQDLARRANNLSYFVKEIVYCYASDPTGALQIVLDRIKALGAQPVFVAFDDDKNFIGREALKAANVPIRFIKRPNDKA